jgi:uncharacterized membrane protein
VLRIFICFALLFLSLALALFINKKGKKILAKEKRERGKKNSVKAYIVQTSAMFLWVMSLVAFVSGIFLENLGRYSSFVFGMVACIAILIWPLITKAANIRKENIQNMKKNNKNKDKNKNKK